MAWVIAVSFAYVVNKWSVFRSRSSTIKVELAKIMKFYAKTPVSGSRAVGDVCICRAPRNQSLADKASLSIIVIILNYIFSKLYIFQKDNEA